MKKYIIALLLHTLVTAAAHAQDYKVIFDITSGDTADHKAVMRQVKAIADTRPDAKLEIAIYGEALGLVMKNQSTQAVVVQNLLQSKKASFKVCAMTMKRLHVTNDQLLPGVEVVPDAIFEIITKQHEGWGYIKVAH